MKLLLIQDFQVYVFGNFKCVRLGISWKSPETDDFLLKAVLGDDIPSTSSPHQGFSDYTLNHIFAKNKVLVPVTSNLRGKELPWKALRMTVINLNLDENFYK